MHIANRYWAGMLLGAILAGGCAKKEAYNRTDSVQSSGGEVAALKVSSIDLGKSVGSDKTVSNATDTFAPGDTIYASVATEGTGPATLRARWMYQDGQVVDETSRSISTNGPEHTEFHVAKASAWPAGKYKVEISVNGTVAGTKEFEVKPR